jgi:D-sedoheptulose 7-phosphate isomerase
MNFDLYIKKNYNFSIDNDLLDKFICFLEKAICKNLPIYCIGDGGSGFSASHFVQDLIKVHGINAKSLSDNIGLITAIANDIDFVEIFKYQLERLPRGLLFVISFSGNSKNLIQAIQYAKIDNFYILSITGSNGGKIKELSDYNINFESDNIYFVEGIHSLFLHYLIEELKNIL